VNSILILASISHLKEIQDQLFRSDVKPFLSRLVRWVRKKSKKRKSSQLITIK